MKKKIILTFTICLFAVGSIFNMNLAQNDQNMDFSLADISVMAHADSESFIKPNNCSSKLDYACYEYELQFACIHMVEVTDHRYDCSVDE